MSLITAFILTASLAINPQDRPQLIIAQGIVESNMNPYATGRCGERGAYQVIPRIHGAVPKGIAAQTDQHVRIMNALLKQHKTIRKAITRYNGAGKQAERYYCKVRKKTIELQIVGV